MEIPDTVTSIGNHAFLGCANLGTVKIGDGVTTIGRMAFRALPNLTKVTFGAKVNEIGVMAFQDCVNLQNFTLPDAIQYLRFRCFAGCSKALTSVEIPTNEDELETELEQGVFSGCTKLATVTFGDTVRSLTKVPYGYWSAEEGYGYTDRADGTELYDFYENGLFYNCTSLKTINWGSGIKEIGDIAFLNCSALTDLTLPANITDIGNHAFFCCSSLKTVKVLGDVNSIGRYAFGKCPALHYVDFRGATMTSEPGYMPFMFDKNQVTAYAADGSTGWKGVAGVAGLPESGTWGGARITYGPPSANAGNPYDFLPVAPVDEVGWEDYKWSSPILLTTSRYVYGTTIPKSAQTVREGTPIYISYCFDEVWRGEAFQVTNRFTLSGTKSGTFYDVQSKTAHSEVDCFCKANAKPDLLQNLKPGTYKLTLRLNNGNVLAETDYYNNTTSITFKVVAVPKYTVKFNLNGGSGTTPASRTIQEGNTVGTLPKATRKGHTLKGWYTKKSGGSKISASTKVKANVTYYAQWTPNKYTIKFNKNGGKGTMKTQSATYGKAVTLRANAFKKSNYAFKGWATKKNGKVVYKNKAKVKNLTDKSGKTVTLYAVWEKSKSANVKPETTVSGTKPGSTWGGSKSSVSSVPSSSSVPSWAVGTFYGGDESAFTTITISKTGKVSGKVQFADGRWTIVGKVVGQSLETFVTDAGGNSAEVVFAIVKTPDGRCRIESEDRSIWTEKVQ